MTAPLRDLFELPGPGPYLLSHSVGCLPRRSRTRLEEALLRPWAEQGSDGWASWLAAIDSFRGGVAALIGGEVAEVCPQPSVSAALGAFLSGLPREAGRDVLLASAHAFPSVGFAMRQFERLGYRLKLIPAERDPIDPQVWADALGPDVAAIVPMHVHSNSGHVSPVAEIARIARDAGALCVVDACQALGILDVEPRASGVDALVGSCVKWLCGGPGAGFLWVRRELIGAIEPLGVGWFSHADPFAFDIRDFRYAEDARRFWGGTPAVAPCVLAASGIETVLEIGVDHIRAANRALTAAAAEAMEAGLDMSARGGTLCLTGDDPDAAEATLRALGCRFDRRGQVLRLSFGVWNDADQARQVGTSLRRFDLRPV